MCDQPFAGRLFYNRVPDGFCRQKHSTTVTLTGATGFDRMAEVVVACPGRSLGLVNHVSKTITATNDGIAGRTGFAAPVRMAA